MCRVHIMCTVFTDANSVCLGPGTCPIGGISPSRTALPLNEMCVVAAHFVAEN